MADRAHKTRQKMTFRLAAAKPRNPLVVLAKRRAAGPHRKSVGAVRSAGKAEIRALERRSTDDADDGTKSD